MKRNKKTSLRLLTPLVLLLVFCVLLGMLVTPKRPQAPQQISSIAEFENYIDQLIKAGNPPGMSFVVVKDGEIIYNKAFGLADGPNQISATPETVYHWWSTTKIFTAVAIFQLQEAGLLSLNDPVNKYLPFFEVNYPTPDRQAITIKQLLNHSSGLPDNVPAVVGWMHLENETPFDQTKFLIDKLPDYAKLKFEPGSKSVYTNVGYMVLGAIIEQVSGETYEDYIRYHILYPLEMRQTDFIYTQTMQPNAAVGMHPLFDIQSAFLPLLYGNRLKGFIHEIQDGKIWFNRFYADSNPPTGLIGPAQDLGRFLLAYLNNGELDGQRILSEESVETMNREGFLPTKNQQTKLTIQGLGWEICGEGNQLCLEHSGGGPGFGSVIRLYPEQSMGFVLTANSTLIDRETILNLARQLKWD